MGHWIGLQATQPGPNRDAIGAWLDIAIGDLTIHRELTVGGGHVGGQLGCRSTSASARRPRHGSASRGPTGRSGRGST